MIRPKSPLAFVAACALLAGCARPEVVVQPIPLGPTPTEIDDYAAAQANDRQGKTTGNDDEIVRAVYIFQQISANILARQDPRLFDAYLVCESYRVTGPRGPYGVPSASAPQFVRACDRIIWRYNDATAAIRNDLEARIAAADRATILHAGAGYP